MVVNVLKKETIEDVINAIGRSTKKI